MLFHSTGHQRKKEERTGWTTTSSSNSSNGSTVSATAEANITPSVKERVCKPRWDMSLEDACQDLFGTKWPVAKVIEAKKNKHDGRARDLILRDENGEQYRRSDRHVFRLEPEDLISKPLPYDEN